MQVAIGKVVGGKVILEGASLPEGTVVTVLARHMDETFEVPAVLEADLSASIAEAERGETIPAAEILARLHRIA
ncbi:MAG: hypothetical protein U1F00_24030 [Rhodoferax sp.]